jgi:Protein of unknown function (DUF3501)
MMTDVKTKRMLTREEILPMVEYGKIRRERRQAISELKKRRRVEVGPFATFYYENYDTMWQQVHEMLYVEKGGDDQITDELWAYNPVIPQGKELVATVMLEIADPARRATLLAGLGGIEDHIFLEIDGERISGKPDPSRENSSPDGKASSVQFVWFHFADAQIAKFKTAGTRVLVGTDHPNYAHMAVMPEAVRATLAEDFD